MAKFSEVDAAAGKPLVIVLRMTSRSSSVYHGNGSAAANRCFLKKKKKKIGGSGGISSLFQNDLETQLILLPHQCSGLLFREDKINLDKLNSKVFFNAETQTKASFDGICLFERKRLSDVNW